MKDYKTAILPILTALAFMITAITNIKIDHDSIDFFASVLAVLIAAGVNIYGIIKSHKKGVKEDDL